MKALPGCLTKRADPSAFLFSGVGLLLGKVQRFCRKKSKNPVPFFNYGKNSIDFLPESAYDSDIKKNVHEKVTGQRPRITSADSRPDGYGSRRAVDDMEDTHDQF